MNLDSNGNFQYQDLGSWYPKSHMGCLPTIQEGKYLDIQLQNGEINLECNEVIEDWDDLDSCSMYSPFNNDFSYSGVYSRASPTKVLALSMYDASPPPNSPVSSMTDSEPDLLAYKDYVDGVLKHWTETADQSRFEVESTHVQLNLKSNMCEKMPVEDMQVPVGYEQPVSSTSHFDSPDSQFDQDVPVNSSENQVLNVARFVDATTNTSPRASSPQILESPSRISFENFRSLTPRILRSPSPISSNSSSPRFVRSPSPLGVIQHGISELPFDEYSNSLNMNANSSYNSYDHVVPDIDYQFQEFVEDSLEFPSYRGYVRQRILDSCQDQLVPEMIEE